MSPERLRISEEEEEEEEEEERCYSDPLHSLPDELLGLILSKITDPKTLIVSSIVSKRIASILSHFQSLSLKFPTPPTRVHYNNQLLWVRSLLLTFNRVRSLRIEFPCCCPSPDAAIFRWKAKIGIRCDALSFLSAKSVRKIDDEKRRSAKGGRRIRRRIACADDVGGPNFNALPHLNNAWKARGLYFCARAMHRLMQLLISRHPNLGCVELVDSKRHGKLSIGGEALIKLRTTMLYLTPDLENISNFITESPWHEKVWYVPKLRLPVSGFEMKEVTLAMSGKKGGGGGVWEEVEGSGDGGFEDDEHGMFGEAMTQILTW